MDAHEALTVGADDVYGFDLFDDRLHRGTGEFVAEHVDADLLVRVPEGVDRVDDAVGRITVGEREPRAHRVDDGLTASGRIRNPAPGIVLEHVGTVVVQYLDALDLRIHVEHLGDLADRAPPVVLAHAAGRVDDEDHVLGVDRYARDRVVFGLPVVRLQPDHLFAQALTHDGKRALVLELFRLLLGEIVLAAYRLQLALQARQPHRRRGRLLAYRFEFAFEHGRLASDLEEFTLQERDQCLEILLRLLEDHRLVDLAQHQQQNDRAETAADAVEERQAEGFGITAAASHVTSPIRYGQSRLTLIIDPPDS